MVALNCGLGRVVSPSFRQNSPGEKEVIACWILVGRSLGKGQHMVFRLHTYNHLISEALRTVYIRVRRK